MNSPDEGYRHLRQRAPVWEEPETGIWFVTTYDIAEEIMRNHDRFSSAVDRISMRKGGLPEKAQEIRKQGWPMALTLSHNDTPSHDEYRKLVGSFFMPKRLKQVRPFVSLQIQNLLNDIEKKTGTFDFLSAFSVPLPIAVIGEYLGMRHLGDENLKIWSDAFADEIGFLTDDDRANEIASLTLACHREMVALADQRRGQQGDDVISALANAEMPDGRTLENSEILSILTQLLVAGNETTTSTLNFAVTHFAQVPDMFDRLKSNPDLVPRFVEEILRVESPIQGQFRKAVGDQEVGGVLIPDGSLIHVRFGSVNRDETVWGVNSGSLDLDARQPKPHMAFGNGIHFCVGAALSRLELNDAIFAMLERFEGVRLKCSIDELQFARHFHQRRVNLLPVEFIR
ncbi:Cytochrome P450 [Parasphingorhabdus marina DSM 22363]|uniref:Cytochrome P450 n=1 Tax=Parasphingorhabdus marina DSM 22363 TaxID=1123272 RepID=A0A1N6D4B8_9SPHN|nr:cytochrome P450 [Parasphingorhabdus marina]SIN65557.1 Cytochrome P450 [Parasphingorhabdus marina DSM 22363]